MCEALPWAHGHQVKGISDFIVVIVKRQTGNQAELAGGMGNQEAAVKRLSRLTHNERLDPRMLAQAVLDQALRQIPRRDKVRLAIDWTIEDDQYLLFCFTLIALQRCAEKTRHGASFR